MKNWLKKIELHQINVFLRSSLFHSRTFLEQFLQPIQSSKDVSVSAQNSPNCTEQFFLMKTVVSTLIYILVLVIVAKCLKKSYHKSRVIRMRHFLVKHSPFAPNNFFCKNHEHHFDLSIWFTYLILAMKKILRANPELW